MGKTGKGIYDVIQFHGCKLEFPQRKHNSADSDSESEYVLENARCEKPHLRARDALCAVMASMASRNEKTWLQHYDLEEELKDRLRDTRRKAKRKSKQCKSERAVFLELVAECASGKVHGYFSRALAEPETVFRVSLGHGQTQLRPASLIVTYLVPFKEALGRMDAGGPLKWKPCGCREVYWDAGWEFAFQNIRLGENPESVKSRQLARSLEHEPGIVELLQSEMPVVLLDIVAALAPRDLAKKHGLNEIVKSEMATLFREAKAQGQAVVFIVGSENEHLLAEKVYLRPPLTDYGLRCGYLRWRQSAEEPWERETCWESRICIGLQMP